MNILVVDDEVDVKVLFEQRFRKEIRKNLVAFTFAHSGEEALEKMARPELNIVLILSDINMPGMSGLELLKRIRETYEQPPPMVMMLTAYGDPDNKNTADELGANDFLTKPIDFNLLKDKLKLANNG
ncbi:MAG: response regulator [Bacteroidota bacterium]